MTDMSQFIAPKSDQMNADDLIGGTRTIKITRVSASPDSAEQPVAVSFEGDQGKPFKPCKSMRRVMVNIWGADASKYVGRSMTLYRDPEVKFGGIAVGGIRISHMTDMKNNREVVMALTASRAQRKPYTVKPLQLQSEPPKASEAEIKAAQDDATTAAKQGKAKFLEWWNGDGRGVRDLARPIMAELTRLCDVVDTSGSDQDDNDPFADAKPTPEEMAAAEAAAREAAEAQGREEGV
ncbi:hypothetical protein A8B82_21260 [Sulfitobacter sp. EhC04]|uniref:hypothetical protein n=1 Tax=Sulfitobacter sp. EhC04 TaxID=1849168 RepID=UPI0007F52736|nr:hypothetical protein [Sulfitobacter sp. EhC04]OAN71123.1 hypothetical protein A8B82_21260 [Sulfitobacter sp. EhC04]